MVRGSWRWVIAACALVVMLVAADGARAAVLPKSVKPLDTELARAAVVLGKGDTAQLRKHVRRAGSFIRKGSNCSAAKALTRVITTVKRLRTQRKRSAAARVAARARSLSRTLLTKQRRKGACGLKIKVSVNRRLRPAITTLPGGRPVGRVAGSSHASSDFAIGEIVLAARNREELRGVLRRTHGKVVKTIAPKAARTQRATIYLIKIPTEAKQSASTIDALRKIEPLARGQLSFSTSPAKETLATAARERAAGHHVGLNLLPLPDATLEEAFPSQFALDGKGTDDVDAANAVKLGIGTTDNTFDWSLFNNTGTNNYGVAEAWRALEIAGKLKSRSVEAAVIDGGFVSVADLPDGTTRTGTGPGVGGNGTHGYDVSQALAALPGNGLGVAGSGGPVVDLRSIDYDFDGFSVMARTYDAIDTGARVISMSFGSEIDALVSWVNIPFEDATQEAAENGVLVVVSAGNESRDVDAEDCFIVCWEEEWIAPCENDGVLCVGGVDLDRNNRAVDSAEKGSNYGREWCESKRCQVELFGPYRYPVDDVNAAGKRKEETRLAVGTSFSAPFVAGVAALVIAARPSITLAELRLLLLSTAWGSSDDTVSRVVNAEGAVRAALGPVAPIVGITRPPSGPGVYKAFQNFDGLAISVDGGCCTYRWSSSTDGFLGTGVPILGSLSAGPGERTVTLEATDSAGRKGSGSTTVNLAPDTPGVSIDEPTASGTYYAGVIYKLSGRASHPDGFGGSLPCSSLQWRVGLSQGVSTTLTGCQPQFTFNATGQWTVILEATTPGYPTGSAKVVVNVQSQPPDSKPIPTILMPDDGASLEPGTTYPLSGAVSGQGPFTYEWRLITSASSTGVLLSTDEDSSFKPGQYLSSNCGGHNVRITFTATNQFGSGTDEITAHVPYPPC